MGSSDRKEEATVVSKADGKSDGGRSPRKRSRPKVAVKVISKRTGGAALVEWDHKRAYVPTEEVSNGKVSAEALDAAVPDSLAWEELIEITITPAVVAEGLYRRNIYRYSDLSYQAVRAAFLEALSGDATALFAKAKEVSQ